MTKVKICGITNSEDALLAAKFGADALGFNFYAKSPRYVAPEKTREICAALPANILKVGVFVNEELEKIVGIAETSGIDAVQLHGDETPDFAFEVGEKSGKPVIKAFRVAADFKPGDVSLYKTDAVLLDAFSPDGYGGTGATFNWAIAKKVREIFPNVYLAGGLTPENVSLAIAEAAPFAVDVCSSVESEKGIKNKIALVNFIAKAKNAPENFPEKSLYGLLAAVHRRPEMYFGAKSLSLLDSFLFGFETALDLSGAFFAAGNFFAGFKDFAAESLRTENSSNWSSLILTETGGDEEKAFDLFFALLEEFKLEKEGLRYE